MCCGLLTLGSGVSCDRDATLSGLQGMGCAGARQKKAAQNEKKNWYWVRVTCSVRATPRVS